MTSQSTPRGNRLHIGLFGNRNAGKSSLVNALTGQEISLVSPVAGTTTDPVYKSFELIGVGPVVFVDTAGLDDQGDLGQLRVEKTRQALEKTDLALMVLTGKPDPQELAWLEAIQEKKIPALALLNKVDLSDNPQGLAESLTKELGITVLPVSAQTGENIPALLDAIMKLVPDDFWDRTLLGDMVGPGDVVLLVMPQDTEAPKGRLILPQVQTTRELLDKKCTVVSCTTDCLQNALAALAHPPKLIITDAHSFPQVWEQKPPESILTAFTILFAGYKGDIRTFLEGAAAVEALTGNSRVLIAEACSHTHNEEDIGRKKLPALLRKKAGEGLTIDHVQGSDFPQDLSPYDLVIHCGACMFNRRYVMSRVAQADRQKVPITNYGIVLAAVSGILDQVAIPEGAAAPCSAPSDIAPLGQLWCPKGTI